MLQDHFGYNSVQVGKLCITQYNPVLACFKTQYNWVVPSYTELYPTPNYLEKNRSYYANIQ